VVPAKALSQTLLDMEKLVKEARNAGASLLIALATEMLREVATGPAFIELVGATLGIQAVLISGQEEAALDNYARHQDGWRQPLPLPLAAP
jgi:exopolyphosphatase/pppGpp-phosphohydrolase